MSGASGFIGSNLRARLGAAGASVTAIARGGIADQAAWEAALPGGQIIFHLAAQTSVYEAERNPLADWDANVRPLLCLLEACRATGARPLILFAATATQYGLPATLPVDESHADQPVTIYDRHKLAAEGYLEHYCRAGLARGASLRLANVYGPGPVSGSADRGVLNLMMRKALRRQALPLYGTGETLRDYVFIDDVVAAFVAAAVFPEAVSGQHFIVASGRGYTLANALQLVAERAALVTGETVRVESVAAPEGLSPIENRSFVGNPTRLHAATGWAPGVSLVEGIDRTLECLQREGPSAQ